MSATPVMSEAASPLTFDDLKAAVAGTAAAFRCRTRLQPAGGEGDKVFPPTYAGAVYAVEDRRVKVRSDDGKERFDTLRCVLLDSVQSQANRMEEGLQNAVDAGRISIPVIEVDFTTFYPGNDKAASLRLIDPVGKITSLQAPHRVADAILRYSLKDGAAFRQSEEGRLIDRARPGNATPLYEICPTALIFGMWDSTGPKGGLGTKFERALVSEIIGVGASLGTRTQSRVDPILARNPDLYLKPDGTWTADPGAAAQDKDGPRKFPRKLSEMNFGNITPDHARYDEKSITAENRQTVDPMRNDAAYIQAGRVRPGGVTIEYAEQTTVLSLAALRRLRFPPANEPWAPSEQQHNRDVAARTVLAALGLCAAELASDAGLDLRSRCLLWCERSREWNLLGKPGDAPKAYALDSDSTVCLLSKAVGAAAQAGVTWRGVISLRPSDELVTLVRKSQEIAVKE